MIDKDLCSELLARELGADLFIMATDADAVFTDWGTRKQKAIHTSDPTRMSKLQFPAGSMGPKVDAACRFATKTGHRAAIGALKDIPGFVSGESGTTVSTTFGGMSWHS